jgi:hypothetical protein
MAEHDTTDDATKTGSQALQLIAAAGPPLTITTALLFYFGWVRTSVEATTLGVNDTVFGYTTQDYVMRSVNALFLPVVVAAVLAIGALVLHGWLVAGIRPEPTRRRRVARVLGSILLPSCVAVPVAAGLVEQRRPELTGLVLPPGIADGVILRRRTDPDSDLLDTPAARRRELRIRVLIGIVVAAAMFWWVGDFAAVVGRGLAYRIADDVGKLPGVVVYSEKNLQIDTPGVHVTTLSSEASAYAFRYDGLRLLERSDGRLFLLPDSWTIDSGTLVVLPDDGHVRIEYTHGSPSG